MIILRQKAFTRAEKEAIKQLYRVTKGLRKLPGGITNLEDAKALKSLSMKLNEGNQPLLMTDSEKIALNNLRLTKLTDGGLLERIHQKYNDRDLLVRTRRIKGNSKKLSNVQLERNKRKLESLERNQILENQKLSIPKGLPNSERTIRFVKKKMPSTVILETLPGSSPASVWNKTGESKYQTLRDLETQTGLLNTRENLQEAKRFVYGSPQGIIATRKDIPEVATVHEISHNMNSKTIPGSDNYITAPKRLVNSKYGLVTRDIGELAEENLASSRTIRLLKRNQKENKKFLDNSMRSYLDGTKKTIWKLKSQN